VSRRRLCALLLVPALLVVPSAAGKDFRPGDVRVCGPDRCVAVVDPSVLRRLASFYYTGPQPRRAAPPKLGTRYYELRYRNGYVTGIVGARRLDRFLTYGVHDGHFLPDVWHVVPRAVSAHVRRLAGAVRPFRLTRAALARSR